MGAKKYLLVLSALLFSCILYGQQAKMVLDGGVRRDVMSQDALQFYRKLDKNGNICAILKVTLTNSIGDNPLSLDVGGMGVTDREVRENGEIWFYVPYQVRRLRFSCKSYQPMDPIEVNLEEGGVYLLKIRNDAVVQSYLITDIQSNFLKVETEPVDASLAYGKDESCSMGSEYLTDGFFSKQLDYGEYYISVSHQLYKTNLQKVSVSEKNEIVKVKLDPDYGYLTVRSNPEGAMVFINGEKMNGTTPFTLNEKIKRGPVRIRVQKDDWHPAEQTADVPGTGERVTVNIEMKPNFGTVVASCEDTDAEIWIDNVFRGRGRWSGNVSSNVTHKLESRKASHQSQSIAFKVSDGEKIEKSIAAPVPVYGSIEVSQTEPAYCQVFIDGRDAGTAPFVKNRLLIGSHTIEFRKDGYIPLQRTVEIAQNRSSAVSDVVLEKGKRKVRVSVTTGDSKANLYIDGVLVPSSQVSSSAVWEGELDEGYHDFSSSRKGHNDGKIRFDVKYGQTVSVNVPGPVAKTGMVNIRSSRKTYVDISGPDYEANYVKTPFQSSLPVGKYSAALSYYNRRGDNRKYFDIVENQTTDVFIKVPKYRSHFSHHFAEISYGYALPYGEYVDSGSREYEMNQPHWIGVNYAYAPRYFGLNTALAFSLDGGCSLALGPLVRLTPKSSWIDLQLYAGLGFRYEKNVPYSDPLFKSFDWKWMVDAGLRFNLAQEYNVSMASLSLGAKICSDKIIPTVGMAFYPGLLIGDSDMETEHFLGLSNAYDTYLEKWMAGAYYSYMPDSFSLGAYTSFLVGMDAKTYSWAIGASLRLIPSSFDLQFYGGVGVQNNKFMGDFGLRMNFDDLSDLNIAIMDIGVGCQVYDGHFVPTVTLGLGISLIGGWVWPLLTGLHEKGKI